MASAPRSLAGQAILVTGGARGIGLESARRLAARGARVALVDLDGEALEGAVRSCPGAQAFVADVTDVDSLDEAVSGAVAAFGGLDVVVANAGVAAHGLVRSMDPAAFERVVEINLLGVWRTVRACLPHVIERRGHLLAVASMAAAAHAPGMAPYAASKAGVEAFANVLRVEVAHLGVTVGCAYFGFLDTPLVRGADEDPLSARLKASLRPPFGRTYPVAVGADALVRGVERRSRRVVAPRWVGAVLVLREAVQRLTDHESRKVMPEADALAEARIAERGAEEASALVGPGGRAAQRLVGRPGVKAS